MGGEWEEYQLGSRSLIKSSKRIFAREYVEDGIPFFRSKDVIDKSLGIFFNYDLFISKKRYLEIKETHGSPDKGDLLISSVGNRSGQPYVVQDEGDFYFKDGNIIWLSQFEGIDPNYLAYWFKSGIGQGALSSIMIGSAQKALTIDSIRNLSVRFPMLIEQKAIAHILGSLDDKIELNRQMNKTLESMAQALFKSWFVDFDPVIDNALAAGNPIPDVFAERAEQRRSIKQQKMEGVDSKNTSNTIQALFPSEFEYTEEMGWIPKGWAVRKIGDLCEKIQNGGTPRRNIPEYWADGTIPWLASGEVRQTVITDTETKISELGLNKSSAKWLSTGTTVIAMYGATAGQVAFIANNLTTNQAVCGLIPSEGYQYFNYLSLERAVSHFENRATGSAQQNISKGIIEETRIIAPSRKLVEILEIQCEGTFSKWISNLESIKSLSRLRDTLLPKLLSGELRVESVKFEEGGVKGEK